MKTVKYVFSTFDEAMTIHTKLFELLRQDHIITRADVYYMIHKNYRDCPSHYFTQGWTSLTYSKVEPDFRRWALLLPEPIELISEYENYKTKTSEAVINAIEAIVHNNEKQRSLFFEESAMVFNRSK